MSQKYFTILTNIGAALHANAQLQQTTVPWTHLVLGDGNGVEPVPSPAQTGVIREVDRLAISSIEPDPNNPNWIVIEAVIPADRGGYVVRETALMGGANTNQCIAVGNYPSATKPLLSEGAGSELVIRVVVEIAHTATVTLKIDPAVVIASRDWVEKQHATQQKRGLVRLATIPEALLGEATDIAVTPEGLVAALAEGGGMPCFTPYLWAGKADAMPQGDTQSSGQQLLDLMYPSMRADVLVTQFHCTEAEWQADPYKRVTHWSLGDGVSWMRPPDKNGVQPGNVGAFYGVGANPSGALLGTAVLDAMQGHIHGQQGNPSMQYAVGSNYRAADAGGTTNAGVTGGPISDGVNGAPRIAPETRPRTWYGIWMIRMYGRVLNPGALDAAGLNARMDMIDARVSTLEGRHKALGDSVVMTDVTASRLANVAYSNTSGRLKRVAVTAMATSANGYVTLRASDGTSSRAFVPVTGWAGYAEILVWPNDSYTIELSNATLAKVMESV